MRTQMHQLAKVSYFSTEAQKSFKINESTGNPLPLGLVEFGIFGNGSDRAVTKAFNTTLTRSMFYSSLTINSGITLDPAGCRIFCTGLLTNNGTIQMDAGAGGSGGSSTVLGGTADVPHTSIEFNPGSAGAIGGNGCGASIGGSGGNGASLTGDGGSGSTGGQGGVGTFSGGSAGTGDYSRKKSLFLDAIF